MFTVSVAGVGSKPHDAGARTDGDRVVAGTSPKSSGSGPGPPEPSTGPAPTNPVTGPMAGPPVATTASRLGVPWGTGALPSRWPRRWPSRHDRVGTPPGRCRRGASRRDSMVAPTFDREWMIRLMCRYRSMRAGVRA